MGVRMAVGGEFFDEIRKDGGYYVDKTELIYELVQNTNNKVTLFTRPRRFGKTLMMSTIESFFDIRRDSREVFAGLNVMKHEAFCAEWMNQYPVMSLSLKDAEGLTFADAYDMLKGRISNLCIRHLSLAESDKTAPADREIFQKLTYKTASMAEIKASLETVMRMMKAVYGKPVILLIDEYDVPLAKAHEAKDPEFYRQMLDVIRGLLSTALKSNDSLKIGVITGCLRIAKESIFTGVNNFASYSVLDRKFSRYFGFTQEEVDLLLHAAGLEEKRNVFRAWYDGYVFGDEAVYCPWDVVNYVADLQYDKTAGPKNYWKNTSGNGIIRNFVERSDLQVEEKFETLMNDGTVIQTISDELTYDSLHETEDNLWSVLLMTGYLTKADPDEQGNTVALRIPNAEIAGIFQDTVTKFFSDHVDDAKQKSMMEAFWSGDEAAASKALSDFLWQTISYMDYHEDYYHAFLAGIFVGRGYSVESNKEHGLGRPDIKLVDRRNRRVLIIEAKKSDSAAQMERDCEEALKQIAEQEYAKDLEEYQVYCYGIAFYRKKALVKKLNS